MFRIIKKCGIIIAWLILLSFLFFDDVHSYTRVMLHELYTESNNIDIAVVGASHVYRGFDSNLADVILNSNTFNLGSSSQQLQGSYYLLVELFKYYSPKLVLLDVNYGINNLEKDGIIQTFLITDYLRESKDKYAYLIKSLGIDGIISDRFPILHSQTSSRIILDPLNFYRKFSSSYLTYKYDYITYENEAYKGKGYVEGYNTMSDNFSNWQITEMSIEKPIPDYTFYWLQKIIELCNKNDTRLILIECPITDGSICANVNYKYYINVMRGFAKENNLDYWNFNLIRGDILRLNHLDYSDDVHMNGHGANKFTRCLCDMINHCEPGFFYNSLDERFDKMDCDDTYFDNNL